MADGTNPLPLERILAWYDTLPESVTGMLAFMIVVKFRKFDVLEDSNQILKEWLGESLDYFQHLGRTLHARGIIDYIMAKEGDASVWQQKLDRNLDMLEHPETPASLKPFINTIIPNLVDKKPDWLAADRSWRELRFEHLTDHALHDWEEYMMHYYASRPFGGKGFGS